ncbi:hypothetical protein [Bradyrhizobium sp. JR3.5]
MNQSVPMTHDHVLVIDGRPSKGSLDRGRLLTTQSLYEYSTIIWVVDSLANELVAFPPRTKAGRLDVALAQRMTQIKAWVAEGHNLIVVGPSAAPIVRPFQDGTNAVARVEAMFPLGSLQMTATHGAKVELASGGSVGPLLEPFLSSMSYRATLVAPQLVPLVVAHRATPGERFAVGGYVMEGKGKVFFIPTFQSQMEENVEQFYSAISQLPDRTAAKVEVLPEWSDKFRTSREADVMARIERLNEKRMELDAQIASEQAILAADAGLKRLIAGTGGGFSTAVIAALQELGLSAVEGPNSRADIIAACAGRYVAVEAKGIDGPVRERQYRQVERWMAELNAALHSDAEEIRGDPEIRKYAECVGKIQMPEYDGGDAKGLLVVGTFRQAPLDQRNDPDFPNTVQRLLERSDTCGMTGLQLFGLVVSARGDPSLKLTIQRELVETRGILERCKNWSEFLTKVHVG